MLRANTIVLGCATEAATAAEHVCGVWNFVVSRSHFVNEPKEVSSAAVVSSSSGSMIR